MDFQTNFQASQNKKEAWKLVLKGDRGSAVVQKIDSKGSRLLQVVNLGIDSGQSGRLPHYLA